MSMVNQVREHFAAHPGVRFDNAALCKALDAEPAQVSVALNQMFSNSEVQRAKREAGIGYDYWTGKAAAPKAMSPGAVASKVLQERAKSATTAKAPDGAHKPKTKKAKKTRAPKAEKVQTISAAATESSLVSPAGSVEFAIRHDGELSINSQGVAVSLRRSDVQRLKGFMTTVAPLWS